MKLKYIQILFATPILFMVCLLNDNSGRLKKSESTNKNTSERIAYVYEYKDDLLIKSFRYENDQLIQINENQNEYY